jgi:hypothetical protein
MLAFPLGASANWHPWENLSGEILLSAPDFQDTRMVFASNAAGMLMWKSPLGQGAWSQFGDRPLVGAPAVAKGFVEPAGGRCGYNAEVYYRTPNDRVRFVTESYICHTMAPPPQTFDGEASGAVTSAPDAVYLVQDRVDEFTRGTNGRLQHTWRIGAKEAQFEPWEDLGGITFVESPSAVSWWDGNRIDIFVKGADTQLWHKVWTSTQGWSGWENLGGVLTSAP